MTRPNTDRRSRYLAMAISSALSVLAPASLLAQQASADSTPADTGTAPKTTVKPKTTELKVVTVTAEKHATNLQKTASAITAVSADTLQQDNITDVTGLNGMVPGLVASKSNGGERIITIRGIGSETPENTNTQPGVAYHIDGVYVVNSIATNAAFIDVDHVEVLRGPQGTLFGQSSTGGTINVVTKQPELKTWSGDATLGLGNYSTVKSNVDLNIPVGDTAAFRISLQKYKHDPYAKQTDTGAGLDNANELSSKLSYLWQPTSDFSIDLTALNYVGHSDASEQKNIDDPDKDPRRATQDYPGFTHIRSAIYYTTIKWELPFAELKSITSFQKLRANLAWDSDGLDTATIGYYDTVGSWASDVTSFSQELNLASKPGGPLDWIVGALYLRSSNHQYTVEFKGTNANPDVTVPAESGPYPANLSYEYLGTVKRESLAPFAQATWHVSDALRLTAGARFNHDEFSGHASDYYGATTQLKQFNSNTWTGKLEADYDLAPSSMLYASITRGYKPGGLNSGSTGAMEVKTTFDPETVTSFEIGSKNRFLDNTLQANFAAFLYNYKNMQYLEEDPIPYKYGIGNIPTARLEGLESEFTYLATSALRFDAGITYMHGKFNGNYYALDAITAADVRTAMEAKGYGSYTTETENAVAAAATNVNGRSVGKIPHWSGNVSGSYMIPIGEGSLTPRLEYVYRGNYQYGVFDRGAMDLVPSYGIWNFALTYLPANIHWSFMLSINNIANKDGINSRFVDPYGSNQTFDTYIPPRVYMLSATYSF